MVDLLEDVAPSSNEIGAVADLAQQMLDLEDEILRLEELLKEKKRDLARVSGIDLAELMQELNVRDFTLANGNKVEVADVVSGSVPSKGAIDKAKGDDRMSLETRQIECFEWLRANLAGDLIKSAVEVQFGRGEDQECNNFARELKERQFTYKRSVGVHPASLNSFIRERLSDGKVFPLDLFKVFTGRKAKIRRGKQ